MANDDPHLQTNGATTNSEGTKIVGLTLLLPFYFLEFLKTYRKQLIINGV
jgi:hypothetical protein